MRTSTAVLLCCCLFVLLVSELRAEQIDLAKAKEAIRTVENSKHSRIGRHGERTTLQITSRVWRTYSRMPFWRASENRAEARAEAERVADVHLAWLWSNLENPTLYRLAAAWNGGLQSVNAGNVSNAQADYAQRVCNVYGSLGL